MAEAKREELSLSFSKIQEAHKKASETLQEIEEKADAAESEGTETGSGSISEADIQRAQASLEILRDQIHKSGMKQSFALFYLSGLSVQEWTTLVRLHKTY